MPEVIVYTIGHSNQPWAEFVGNLKANKIETVVDVRSKPRSRFGQFHKTHLQNYLPKENIAYIFSGDTLGGHPTNPELYDSDHHVVYERIASKRPFRNAIKQLIELAGKSRVAIMCKEEKPADCHRHPLIARYLLERRVKVLHIRRRGPTENATAYFNQPANPQLPLFEQSGEDPTWRSPTRIP